VHLKFKEREDTVIAAIWSFGMSVGVIFTSLTPGYNVEMMTFLFGNILWASAADIYLLVGLDTFILLIAFLFHRKFIAICFDEEQARIQNIPVTMMYFLLLSLVAITVVLLIQIIGAILVIAILTLPAAIAGAFASRLSKMMALASLFGIGFTFFGIFLSFLLNWPPGATISLTATAVYLFSLFIKKAF
jgi:zinc transport system permease protein